MKKNSPDIAFIVGMGRSGTTLLTNMLNSHSKLISTPENEFILFSEASYAKKDFSDPGVVNSFLDIFNYNFNTVLSIWKPQASVKQDIAGLTEKNFGNACKAVYLNYPFSGAKKEVQCIIDKNPSYSLYIDKLVNVYPDAKFIVLVRDYRDNMLSRWKYALPGQYSFVNLALAWNYYYQKAFASLKRNKVSWKQIRYEDLVASPEKTLREICSFLGVEFDPHMLQFQGLSKEMLAHVREHAGPETFTRVNSMHSNLETDVNLKRVKAYEKEFTGEQIGLVEYLCGGYGERFGYVRSKQMRVPFSWRIRKWYNLIKIRMFFIARRVYYSLPVTWRLRFLQRNQSAINPSTTEDVSQLRASQK